MRERLIENNRYIADGREISELAIVQIKKLEHDYLIARLGLQGTLRGCVSVPSGHRIDRAVTHVHDSQFD